MVMSSTLSQTGRCDRTSLTTATFITQLPSTLRCTSSFTSAANPIPSTVRGTSVGHTHRRPKRAKLGTAIPIQAVANATTLDHPLGHRFVDPRTREPCILVGVDVTSRKSNGGPTRIFDLSSSLEELEQLAETAGLSVVATVTQNLPHPDPSTYIRSGKVSELKSHLSSHDSCTAIFDVDLTPGQQRSLEKLLSSGEDVIKVIDRTALILDIFAQHAATREGQLQVELALYEYRLPRLTRMWTHLERQSGAGGVGLRGPGETQLEVDRRLISERVTKLKGDLELVRAHRTRLRTSRRRKVGAPVVALIGYTNAGKSTLLNAMSGAGVLAADALFATLDPTTRRARLDGVKMSPEILLTDTVGFVQNLPTQLVAAFRATLEEVVEADLLLHVVDGGVDDDLLQWQMEAVRKVVEQIGAGGKPTVVIVNKIDTVDAERTHDVCTTVQDEWGYEAVAVCGKDGTGVSEIGVAVEEALREAMLDIEVVIPYERGDLTGLIYRQGCVIAEEFGEDGTRIIGRVPGGMWTRLRPFMVVDQDEKESNGGDDNGDGMWKDMAKKRHKSRDI